jgi:hypothetical protein
VKYPENSEIFVCTASGPVTVTWVKENRAEVEMSKWNDLYGTIDSFLRWKPASPSGSVLMARTLALDFLCKAAATSKATTVESTLKRVSHVCGSAECMPKGYTCHELGVSRWR